MEPSNLEYAVRDLTESIHEIKLNTERLVTKLEQVNDNIEKLERSVEDLHTSLSEQDRRLTKLEQLVPRNLIEDVAILKQNQSSITKILWLLGGGTLTALGDMLLKMLQK
jgi:septal ring factor EnvC (AmiA/AmiB activator)